MAATTFTHRPAKADDLETLRALMDLAIGELQKAFLREAEIASSRTIMGLDTQLIEDSTYFVVEADGRVAGCGGWSRRATLYGGDQSPGRDAALLDPTRDAARVGQCTSTRPSCGAASAGWCFGSAKKLPARKG